MPVIVFHGTADTLVSPVNAEQTIAQWSKTNACLATEYSGNGFVLTEKVIGGEVPHGYSYRKHTYLDTNARLLMEKWLVEGLGHAWSGSPKPSKYGDPKGPQRQRRNLALLLRGCRGVDSFAVVPRIVAPALE